MKPGIRQRIIAHREALPTAVRAEKSAEISRRLSELAAYRQARVVLAYLNFGAEFASEHWVRQVLTDGKRLLLPRVNRTTRQLDLYRIDDLDRQLEYGSYGIREPVPALCPAASLAEADFVLLPGVAFTRQGIRLGYGGGFYDKLLAQPHPRQPALVAAAFELQVVDALPREATDRDIGWLVTENETIPCTPQVGC